MPRSAHKGAYIDVKLLKRVLAARAVPEKERDKAIIKTYSRESVISPEMINITISVHNGKIFLPIKIREEMIGHRLGEFSPTRKFVKHGGKIQREVDAKAGATAAQQPVAPATK